MRCILLLGLKRGLSGRVLRTEVPEHKRWKRSEKDAKGFTGSDVRQVKDCVCSSVIGARMKTVRRYFLYAALLRCGHQKAITLYLKAINIGLGASLVVQWLSIHLPIQGTLVQSLVLEDSTCLRATQPSMPQLLSPCTYFLAQKVACVCQRRPSRVKDK